MECLDRLSVEEKENLSGDMASDIMDVLRNQAKKYELCPICALYLTSLTVFKSVKTYGNVEELELIEIVMRALGAAIDAKIVVADPTDRETEH